VNHYTVRPYFASSFGLPDDPNLTSLEALETELANNPTATAREDSLLHSFSRMEKYIIINHLFPTPFSHNFCLLPQNTDLIFPLSSPIHTSNGPPMLDFLHVTAPEWSNVGLLDSSRECGPGEHFLKLSLTILTRPSFNISASTRKPPSSVQRHFWPYYNWIPCCYSATVLLPSATLDLGTWPYISGRHSSFTSRDSPKSFHYFPRHFIPSSTMDTYLISTIYQILRITAWIGHHRFRKMILLHT
jgi:hypothetical protein